jgi:uncharacterized protein (TIGR00266 family)
MGEDFMDVQVEDRGAFSWVQVGLEGEEQFVSESGAMFRASTNIDIEVTTRGGKGGGILSGIGRSLAGESFFLSTYRSLDGQPGDVGLAPTHQGEIRKIELDGSARWLCTGGSYLGSARSLELDTAFQGIGGMLSGESLSFMGVTGEGPLVVTAFGKLTEIEVDGNFTVDTGHVVAFEETLSYSVGKAAKSFIKSFLVGEGLVLKFSGRGRVYVQSHNPDEFGKSLGSMLPPRREG